MWLSSSIRDPRAIERGRSVEIACLARASQDSAFATIEWFELPTRSGAAVAPQERWYYEGAGAGVARKLRIGEFGGTDQGVQKHMHTETLLLSSRKPQLYFACLCSICHFSHLTSHHE